MRSQGYGAVWSAHSGYSLNGETLALGARGGRFDPGYPDQNGYVLFVAKIKVGVHHFDGNNKNHEPDNLIPLCMTHHTYYHSRYKDLVEQKIIDYRNKYLQT